MNQWIEKAIHPSPAVMALTRVFGKNPLKDASVKSTRAAQSA
ncbi:MAG: hypothetical protein SBU_000152 [Candidatus Syntrophoarchaeum butanivorans]|uniref:Uncharacterized protein n=1 Tax=Candidatus Syntropharchaeum butanivorans TaxID=1839936 RepID=A0A1F2P697_9EURY|nr:MAG: hypothetical protein SBU_000152 [Candidatus Syntrophoarchaeum butanivorans]